MSAAMQSRPLTEFTGLSLPELASIERFLVGCTVPLIYEGDTRTGILGTGTFVSFLERVFFVTAGHHFTNADPTLMAIPERAGKNVHVWTFGHATIHHPKNTDEHDVAVIELLDPDFVARVRDGWTILDGSNVEVADAAAENYLIAGYPDATVKYENAMLTPSALMQLYTAPYDGEIVGDRGDFDLFFRYGEAAGNTYGFKKDTPHLGGASGALVFALGARPAGVWSPEAVLKVVGVQVSFIHSKYVRAKKWGLVEHVLSLITGGAPA
jgi:hypothetical protein